MPNLIGVSGLAGAGKDLFCSEVKEFYSKNEKIGRKVHVLSLAKNLKQDVRQSCLDIYGIDSVNASREEKNKIRDLLVFYGDVMRQKSEGSHWVKKLNEEVALMEKEGQVKDNDIVMVSDIRYSEFPKDEVQWIKDKGTLVHISKYILLDNPFTSGYELAKRGYEIVKHYDAPPNKKEKFNDPRVKEAADYLIDWPKFSNDLEQGGVQNYVKNFCDWYEERIK